MKKTHNGFSLIELLIALAIVGILSVTAINIYSRQVRQGRRLDGINTLLAISLAEERYRSTHATYGTLALVWGGVSTSPEGYYTLSISNQTASSYTAMAAATGDQVNDASGATSCTTLTLSLSSGTLTKTPAACWPN